MDQKQIQQRPKPLKEGRTKSLRKRYRNTLINMGPPPKPIKPVKSN